MKLKKKQHYVSQFYLKAWSKNKDHIYACDLKSQPFLVRTNATAYSNFFYRVSPLSIEGIAALKNIAQMLHAENTIIYKKIIQSINRIVFKGELFKRTSCAKQDQSYDETNELLKEFKTNIIEEYFAYFENKASPIIKKILESEEIYINKQEYKNLLFFITLQLLRSKKVLDRANSEFKKYHPILTNDEMYTISIYVSLIMSEKLSQSLNNDLNTLHIVKNRTNVNIITSDNPCVNYKFHESNNTEFECILPISPYIYLILKENPYSEEIKKYISQQLANQQEVNLLNKLIVIEETFDVNNIRWVNGLMKKNSNRYLYALHHQDFI